jgi:hypothetical protein
LHHLIAAPQDYRDRTALQAAIIAHRRKQERVSWRNAIEKCNILVRFDETRDSLVLSAMLSGNLCCAIDRAGVADLGGTRVALKQERSRSRTGRSQQPEQNPKKD